jgi:ribosomal protein S18 acetylase RimI-like enzyme
MHIEMPDDVEMPYPHYRCRICGKDLPLTETRLTVSCSTHRDREDGEFTVRDAMPADQRAVEELCDRAWGETELDSFGTTFDVLRSHNILAETSGEDGTEVAGLISVAVHGGELAIVLLSVYPQFQGGGIGSALVEAAVRAAADKGMPFAKVAVTNDDVSSLYFYQRHGFVLYELAVGVIADRLGQREPGFGRIPMRDEIRLRRPVAG